MLDRAPRSKPGRGIKMALALVLRKTNFFPYRTCEEPGMFTLFPGSLSPPFCTGPNIYRESITLLDRLYTTRPQIDTTLLF